MKPLPSIRSLTKKYRLSEENLWEILYECFKHHLSEDELEVFIDQYYFKLEMKLNKRYQK